VSTAELVAALEAERMRPTPPRPIVGQPRPEPLTAEHAARNRKILAAAVLVTQVES